MKKVLLTFAFAMLSLVMVLAQSKTITGRVTSAEEPDGIPGASVVVKGTAQGVITDLDGSYSVQVPADASSLIFSFVGYLTKEMPIGSASIINVTMNVDVKTLNEVVVVGYGTQERREITGSVTSIDSKAIENLISPSFESQLAGRAPGVSITTPSGILGAAPIIRIRGVNSLTAGAGPLIVIDGVPVVSSDRSAVNASNPLANINPADIASFEVLKDGSASAIYGSRAANGVILITTKRGAAGKAKVSYNTSMGFNEAVETFDLLSGDEFVTIANEKRTNANQSPLANPGVNTDWQDLVFRKGFVQQHNLSISGGSEATKYFFSLGFTDQESAVRPNELSRYSFRANVDHSISKAVRLGMSMSYSYTEIYGLNNGSNSLSGAIYNSTRALPNVPIFDADNTAFDGYNITANGATTGFGTNLAGPDNNIPNIGFVIDNNIYRSRTHRVIGNAYGEVDIATGLTARSQIGVDLTLADDFQSLDARHGDGRSSNGSVYMATNPAFLWNWQNTLNYQTVFAEDHSLNVTAGLEYQFAKYYGFSGSATDISDDYFRRNNLITGSYNNQFSSGSYTERGFDSYFGRLNYSFKGKYLASFTLRNDGISDLVGDNKRGTFFGGSVGWRVSDEAFFNSELISDLKFRASYAEVGNTDIDSFAAFGGYAPVLGGAGAGIGYNRIANTGLQWETSKKLNVGLDMTIGKVSVSADYFSNDVDGLILAAPTAPSLGVPGNSINQNIGAMTNSGFELRVASNVINRGKFSWNTDFNITFIKNEVTNLISPITSTYNRTEVGNSIGELYGFRWAGVNPANGNPMYYSGDDIIQYNLQQSIGGVSQLNYRAYDPANPSDISVRATNGPTQEFLGGTLPKWQGGWSNSFTFGNFDAEIFTRFSGGNYIMNESLRGLLGQGFSNNHASILNRWTESGQVTDMPKLYSGQDQNMWQNSASNSRFVEKGDYLKIQNIVLGYTIPAAALETAFSGAISNARIFAQVQNPFTFTKYTGLDPEANSYSNQRQFGVDWNVAPIVRTYTLGLSVGF
ncbi:TonB-linked SusC/RagA family outer membrane protein [Algoriphagus ratkowskyi]|uniref:TonB-dependent receptor n=1 Tax=Algoriphagus ratkowskyi TaxID=57028 RepID=A0A2W7RN39_9BACT|nr:TonB-dependent receptor [Algoriphagus ratkowskyi]PZX59870.1 TonB-linked SusC/RagA family outer membrane protein [Algoriphagus ratkowskyi]TXD78425.1 TonB-dependent receptor [Algoriphagus ratkowskyi]